jgi:hypothetical protein
MSMAGNDAAAQVERAGDPRRHQRDACNARRAQHIAHLQHRDAEELPRDRHGDEFAPFSFHRCGRIALLCLDKGAALLLSADGERLAV